MSLAKKAIRNAFRAACLSRDGFKCRVCGGREPLDVHHIIDRSDAPGGGYTADNGITLCRPCHLLAERPHRGLPAAAGYAVDDLRRLVASPDGKE